MERSCGIVASCRGVRLPGGHTYLGREAFPGVERLVRGVHSLLGLGRSAVRHPGDLRAGGRVQDGEVGGRGHPAAAHVALRAEQRSRHVQGVAAVHGGGQPGQDEPEEAAGPRHTEGGHTGKRRLDLRWGEGEGRSDRARLGLLPVGCDPRVSHVTASKHKRRALHGPLPLRSRDAFTVTQTEGTKRRKPDLRHVFQSRFLVLVLVG